MRGGAIPLLLWGSLLSLTTLLNVIWMGSAVAAAIFCAALVMVFGTAGMLILRAPESVRRGEPGLRRGRRAIVRASSGAMLLGSGLGVFVFGFSFGHFPIYFGAGMMVVGAGRIVLERRAQHESLQRAEGERDESS